MAQLIRPFLLAACGLAFAAASGAAASGAGAARAACLPYEPAEAMVAGRLVRGGDLPAGEAPRYRLRLEQPVCTLAGSGLPGEEGVRVVELVFPRGAPPLRPLFDRRLAASGSLFRVADGRVRLTVTGLARAR